MKDKIHPKYMKSTVTCACGNKFETGSTKPEINVEICSECHPLFTGTQKFIDTAGRMDKFRERQEKAAKLQKMKNKSKKKKTSEKKESKKKAKKKIAKKDTKKKTTTKKIAKKK